MMRFLICLLLLTPAASAAGGEPGDAWFELKIRPILFGTCFRCHGGERTARGLRVDSRAALLRGGRSGPALVPGAPAKSLLLRALQYEDTATLHMPPDGPLPPATVADFAAWIRRGADWPAAPPAAPPAPPEQHWAFRPLRRGPPPPGNPLWSTHPVDRFIAAEWQRRQLTPVGPADRRSLLRRVTFDLLGLPPSAAMTRDFLADTAPAAWQRLVERLLASPQYGERWGRHWMDVVRYADTAGDNADYPVPEAHLYRDYIIDAFNQDMPYDQFVREQIAGDLLARAGWQQNHDAHRFAEQTIATGYLALSRRYATGPYELWHLTLEDTIDTLGRSILGLTLRCARCHDHKFDPVTQQDYYALYGIFASTQFAWAGGEEFHSKQFGRQHFAALLPPPAAAARWVQHRQTMAQLEQEARRLEAAGHKDQASLCKARVRDLERRGLPPGVPGAYAVADGGPVAVPLQPRGEPGQQGPLVPRGVPRFLAAAVAPPAMPAHASGRLELAQWLTRPDQPLTARVLVNRIWQHHFGRGIVETPSNFGLRGTPPSHPELLDYLATYFIDHGWSIKAVHRLILSSRTYQLAAQAEPANAAKDPANQWYWRCDRRRLDAEALRDALMATSGTLQTARPGEHPFPPINTWRWTQHAPFKDVYPSPYRTVYLMTQRLQRHPFLALFDGPDTNTTTEQRSVSTVPLQGLFLLNSPFIQEQATAFADRLALAAVEPATRVRLAYCLAYARAPAPAETSQALAYVARYTKAAAIPGKAAAAAERAAWVSLARVLLCANEFVYLD